MLVYERFVPRGESELAMINTVDHVRAHLSSIADADDDPETNIDDVTIEYVESDAGTMVVGSLDMEPDAPYLKPDFDPSTDGDYTFERWVPEGVSE